MCMKSKVFLAGCLALSLIFASCKKDEDKKPESIQVNPTSLNMVEGTSQTIAATVLPEGAVAVLEWSSQSTSIATVSNGTVNAVAEGSTKIVVKAKDTNVQTEIPVTVTKIVVPLTGISVSPEKLTLKLGEATQTITATPVPANATNFSATFDCDDTFVATVTAAGVVTAVGVGETAIKVKSGSFEKTVTVTVVIQNFTVEPTSVTLNVGETERIRVSTVPADAPGVEFELESDDEEVATVSEDGLITAVGEGTAIITVSSCGISKEVTVTVTAPGNKIEVYPLDFVFETASDLVPTKGDGFVTLTSNGRDPNINTTKLRRALLNQNVVNYYFKFEYKTNKAVTDGQLYFCVNGGAEAGKHTGQDMRFEKADNWTTFSYGITFATNDFGFGTVNHDGVEPKNHFLRFDPVENGNDPFEISIRNMRIEVEYTGNPDIPKIEINPKEDWTIADVSSVFSADSWCAAKNILNEITPGNCWHSGIADDKRFVIIDFSVSLTVSEIYYWVRQNDQNNSAKHIVFSVSNDIKDNDSWQQVYENKEIPRTTPKQTLIVDKPKPGRYMKIQIPNTWNGEPNTSIGAIDFKYTVN